MLAGILYIYEFTLFILVLVLLKAYCWPKLLGYLYEFISHLFSFWLIYFPLYHKEHDTIAFQGRYLEHANLFHQVKWAGSLKERSFYKYGIWDFEGNNHHFELHLQINWKPMPLTQQWCNTSKLWNAQNCACCCILDQLQFLDKVDPCCNGLWEKPWETGWRDAAWGTVR